VTVLTVLGSDVALRLGAAADEARAGSRKIIAGLSRVRFKVSHVEGAPQLIRTLPCEGCMLAATVERVFAD
jgi:hypothetical protein